MKLVDVPDSKSGGLHARVGSTPTAGKKEDVLCRSAGNEIFKIDPLK
jgi:hypothetical protein